MAVIAYPGNLQTSQAGNADSTNVIQRVNGEVNLRQMVLRIVTNAGTTVTINIMGSADNVTYWNVPYSPMGAAPGDWTKAAIVITTATTNLYALMPGQGWTFLKLVMTLNTGMTPTSDLL
jgi:hypothetical protein